MITTNTKTIARKTGLTTAQVNETARDLGIEMTYRADLRHWEIVNRAQAAAFLEQLLEAN